METHVGIFGEFWLFLKQNTRWWLIPLLLVTLEFVGLVIYVLMSHGPAHGLEF